jgi:serine/threonine protein kinase
MGNPVGQRLANYRVIRLLGKGGFGDVYLGEHIHLNTQAAIKVLQTRLVGSHNAANLWRFTVRSTVRIDLCGHASEPAAIMGWSNYTCNGYLGHLVRHVTKHSTTEYRWGLERNP